MPRSATISFGIEFEFDHVNRDGERIIRYREETHRAIQGWNIQYDQTAGTEISTPVLTDLNTCVNQIKRQFNYWCHLLRELAPYPLSNEGRSLGQHIHIGRPRRRLNGQERRCIGKAIANVYPFLASIHGNPIPSNRGLNSHYSRPSWFYMWEIPHRDHFCEISASHLGTVEFRLFDSNIPQTSLTCIYLMQKIARRHLRNEVDINRSQYRDDRTLGLRIGLTALDVGAYLRKCVELMNDDELPEIDSVREMLYIVSRYYLNPYQVYRLANPNPYEYFRLAYCNPERFLDNFLECRNIGNRDRLLRWKEEARRVNNLNELVGIAIASRERVIQAITERVEIRPRRPVITRSYVRQFLIAHPSPPIVRISQVYGMSAEQVAQRIADLLRSHGDGFVNTHDANYIMGCPERYYVLIIRHRRFVEDVILGCIAINIRNGEISNLVVDRRFRRLGLARRLLRYVLSLNLEEFSTWVRKENRASLALFRSLGFTETESDHRSIRLVLRRGDRE